MFLKLFLIVVVLNCTSIVLSAQYSNDSCAATAYPIQDCTQSLSSSCRNATFVADRHAYDRSCSPVSLYWSMPMYNMTIIFKNNLTQPYSICMPVVYCAQAYRTLDAGQEIPVKWDTSSGEPTCFKTEHRNQSIMKFRFDAGKDWKCYGTSIRFTYTLEH